MMAAGRCFGAANVSWLMQRAVEKASVPQNTTTFTISLAVWSSLQWRYSSFAAARVLLRERVLLSQRG